MAARPPTSIVALFVALAACAPDLKPGTDRADAATAIDVITPTDAGTPDVGAPDAGIADAPPPSTTQTSCPDARERGCGLVEIPGGTFTMGVADEASASSGSPAQPLITVGPVALDAYEVTVARFRRFWSVARTLPAVTRVVYPGGTVAIAEGVHEPDLISASSDSSCNWSTAPGEREQHPINCINWFTAQAFCVWDGGRLPTDAEWEFAARGRAVGGLVAERRYPWGDDDPLPTCDRARWNLYACPGEDHAQTRRVGSFAPSPDLDGARLYDLAGNIYEWTVDNFVQYDGSDGANCWGALATGRRNPLCDVDRQGARTIRGGSWFFNTVGVLRSASRFGVNMGGELPLPGIGIRCARTR